MDRAAKMSVRSQAVPCCWTRGARASQPNSSSKYQPPSSTPSPDSTARFLMYSALLMSPWHRSMMSCVGPNPVALRTLSLGALFACVCAGATLGLVRVHLSPAFKSTAGHSLPTFHKRRARTCQELCVQTSGVRCPENVRCQAEESAEWHACMGGPAVSPAAMLVARCGGRR
jgi:hypothetical protein